MSAHPQSGHLSFEEGRTEKAVYTKVPPATTGPAAQELLWEGMG